MLSHIEKWTEYAATRRGTYEFRCATRYKGVADRLFAMGFKNYSSLMDVGAGSCQFGRYLRELGWRGVYIPIDAVIDGTDLETWDSDSFFADFVVCIEVVEHVHNPARLIRHLRYAARLGVVLTTPNCEVVDVLGCDPTHVSVIPPANLDNMGFTVERHSWFHTQDTPGQLDTLLAWRWSWPPS